MSLFATEPPCVCSTFPPISLTAPPFLVIFFLPDVKPPAGKVRSHGGRTDAGNSRAKKKGRKKSSRKAGPEGAVTTTVAVVAPVSWGSEWSGGGAGVFPGDAHLEARRDF